MCKPFVFVECFYIQALITVGTDLTLTWLGEFNFFDDSASPTGPGKTICSSILSRHRIYAVNLVSRAEQGLGSRGVLT